MQAIEMRSELHDYAETNNLKTVKRLVKGGANIEELDQNGKTALTLASRNAYWKIVVYLAERGANVSQIDDNGMTPLHWASCFRGNVPTVKCLLKHGASITERSAESMTALLCAASNGSLEVVKYLLSSEGGASISETDDVGNTALLVAASSNCSMTTVQWLLEHGGAQITDINDAKYTVWSDSRNRYYSQALPDKLRGAYRKNDDGMYFSIDGEYVPGEDTEEITAMLRVMVLHGSPPESLAKDLAPPLQRILRDGTRLRAQLPPYLARRRALLDAHCPLLPPLRDLVHGFGEPTTDELWATGLGALQLAKRSRPEKDQSSERRPARLRQKRQ
jgi:hypothetical protein